MSDLNHLIFLICFLLPCAPANAQISGTIYYTDGAYTEVDSFEDVNLELINFTDSRSFAKKTKETHEYQKTFDIEKLNQLNFIYDRENSSGDFYYLLTIKAQNSKVGKIRLSLKAWDWMEISLPESDIKDDKRIIFFYRQKRMKIDRIIFK